MLSNQHIGELSTVDCFSSHQSSWQAQADTIDPYGIRLREKLTCDVTISTEAVSNKKQEGLAVSPTDLLR
jgi:hypothetical protein